MSREVIDDELTPPPSSSQAADFANVARRVLERIELACGDLGSSADAAEPLVELAIALTGRRRGTIARLLPDLGLETLAAVDVLGPCREFRMRIGKINAFFLKFIIRKPDVQANMLLNDQKSI